MNEQLKLLSLVLFPCKYPISKHLPHVQNKTLEETAVFLEHFVARIGGDLIKQTREECLTVLYLLYFIHANPRVATSRLSYNSQYILQMEEHDYP